MVVAASRCALLLLATPLAYAFRPPQLAMHHPLHAARRSQSPRAAAEDSDDALAASLRQRMQALEQERESPEGEGEPPAAAASSPADAPLGPTAAPPPADGGSVFRFEEPAPKPQKNSITRSVAGLDYSDEQRLTRLATIWGGRALTAITVYSLVFYIYVGLSGGITDGFDRYTEPIEDIRTTMAREDPRFAQ